MDTTIAAAAAATACRVNGSRSFVQAGEEAACQTFTDLLDRWITDGFLLFDDGGCGAGGDLLFVR